MAYNESFAYDGALVLYCKPVDKDSVPLVSPWNTGVVSEYDRGHGMVVFRGLVDGQRYLVFSTKTLAGPTSADAPPLGEIRDSNILEANAATAATEATAAHVDAATAATEVGKVHRSATPVAAGAAMRRTAVADSATTLDETLGPTP